MPNEIVRNSSNQLTPSTTNVSGDQYIVAGNLIVNQQSGLVRKQPSFLSTRSNKYYSLFVLKKNTLIASEFSLDYKLCLNICCCSEVSKLTALDETSIAEIISFPCIFCEVNETTNNPNINQVAYIGIIESISKQQDSLIFKFAVCKDLPQILIKNSFDAFCIQYAPLRSELDKPHWAIKKHNLLKTISDLQL